MSTLVSISVTIALFVILLVILGVAVLLGIKLYQNPDPRRVTFEDTTEELPDSTMHRRTLELSSLLRHDMNNSLVNPPPPNAKILKSVERAFAALRASGYEVIEVKEVPGGWLVFNTASRKKVAIALRFVFFCFEIPISTVGVMYPRIIKKFGGYELQLPGEDVLESGTWETNGFSLKRPSGKRKVARILKKEVPLAD